MLDKSIHNEQESNGPHQKKKVEDIMTNMSNVYPVKSVATSLRSRADPFLYKKVIQHSQQRYILKEQEVILPLYSIKKIFIIATQKRNSSEE